MQSNRQFSSARLDAICALKEHDPDAIELVIALEDIAFRRGGLDLLVTAYRASPELLRVLLHAASDQQRLRSLIRKVRDIDLAEFVGYQVHVSGDRRKTLTPREREVYELLIQGLTNREIAKLLFIEESTVKVHAHHIYDKLGTALAHCAHRSGDARARRIRRRRRPSRHRRESSRHRCSGRTRGSRASRESVVLVSAREDRFECGDDAVSNWLSTAWASRSRATRLGIASRYGRSDVIAL